MSDPDARVELLLVALDGSNFSERAVDAAVLLARRLDAVVELYSVVSDRTALDEREAHLEILRPREVLSQVRVDVDPDPAGAIDRALRHLDNSVVCLASRGSRLRMLSRGSVTTELLRRRADAAIIVGSAFEQTRTGKGIVVCVDGDPATAALVPIALRWAQMLRERCTVMTVAELLPPPLDVGPVHRAFGPDVDDVDKYLEHLVAPYRMRGEELDTRAIYDPIGPVSGLRDYLFMHPAALVTIGSRLHAALGTAVLGRNAAAIIRQSTAPVLAVPMPS